MMNAFKTILLFFSLAVLSSCYSFTASTLASHIKTIHIFEVEDKTLDPVLANNLRAGVLELFRKNASSVRVIEENATADFKMTLLSYSNKPDNYNAADQVETYRVSIRVSVSFYDNVKERIIYEEKSLFADGIYDVQANETEDRHGQVRAIEKLQDLIITNALAKW